MRTGTHARQRLDERLSAFKGNNLHPPPKGWIRAIRDALGMSRVQLASRLGIRPQTVETFEKSEAAGSVQLSTLRRVAEALDCTVVYAFVPRTSLENAVMQRARKIAIRNLRSAAHSMKLEAQETNNAGTEARIQTYIRDAIKESDVWNEP